MLLMTTHFKQPFCCVYYSEKRSKIEQFGLAVMSKLIYVLNLDFTFLEFKFQTFQVSFICKTILILIYF